MKIGIIRHFKVLDTRSFWMDSEEFRNWADHYDESPVKPNDVNMTGHYWRICCVSDMHRAMETARAVCPEDSRQMVTPLLREVPVRPFVTTRFKLPHPIWMIAARIAWRIGHPSQEETYNDTQKRIRSILDFVEETGYQEVLFVCHGFLMWAMNGELRKRGFHGYIPRRVRNGVLHVLKK